MHPAINVLPWWLRQQRQYPAIAVTMHDLLLPYLFPKAGLSRRWVTQRLMRDADAVIVTNEEDEEQARRWIEPPKGSPNVTLIPIGSNIPVAPPPDYNRATWRARLHVRADETLIAYFGLLGRSKGVDMLVRTLAELPSSVRLLLIGGEATTPQDRAYAAEVEQLIGTLGLHDRVIRTGHCTPTDVSAHLLAADMAALPYTDGASFRRGSLLAALAHGVPVITTKNPSTSSGQAGRWTPALSEVEGMDVRRKLNLQSAIDNLQSCTLLIPPNNHEALVAAIRRLVGDAALRKHLGAKGKALAAQFDWKAIAERHEELYRTMMK